MVLFRVRMVLLGLVQFYYGKNGSRALWIRTIKRSPPSAVHRIDAIALKITGIFVS